MECDLIGGKVPLAVTYLITMTKHLTGETKRGGFILVPSSRVLSIIVGKHAEGA